MQNLYRLQKELREEKSGIINVYKESENVRKGRNIEKNVEQILSEMRKARKLADKSKKKKKLFKNKSDSLLDYKISEESQDRITKKTPEQNRSNVKRFEIHSIKKRKGERFLIKWEGYSDEENTWEHRADIPQCVLKVIKQRFIIFFILFYYLFSTTKMTLRDLDLRHPKSQIR